MTLDEIFNWLEDNASNENRAGMARFGIDTSKAFGVSNAILRPLSKTLGKDHERARHLWESGWREARLLAIFTDEPRKVTAAQAWKMANDFNSWEIVDHAAALFVEANLTEELIPYLALDEREFVRRTAFAMIASAAVHQKRRSDADFLDYLPLIEQFSNDPRNFVKKAVNWALRQIGKRSLLLHATALELASKLMISNVKSAQWIGKDAVRELTDAKTLAMIGQKKSPTNRKAILGKS
jgi:3-methyladenine DNA glycosylase AlkD